MSDVAKMTQVVLLRVAEFLAELPENQIADLAEGRARISYIPWGQDEPVKPATPKKKAAAAPKFSNVTADVSAVCAALGSAETSEEGGKILASLPSPDDVRAVAAALGLPVTARSARSGLTKKIIEFAIEGRLNSMAIRAL